MVLSEENLKYLGLIGLALIMGYVFYKCVVVKDKMMEGLTNNSPPSDYTSISTKLEGDIKIVKNVINIDASRSQIEDALTDLQELIRLGELNTLLQYASGKMDTTLTNSTAKNLRSFNQIQSSITDSLSYLDSASGSGGKTSTGLFG